MGVMFYSATEINLDLLQVKILREKSCYDDNAIVVKSRDGKTLGHVDYLTAKALVQIMNTWNVKSPYFIDVSAINMQHHFYPLPVVHRQC